MANAQIKPEYLKKLEIIEKEKGIGFKDMAELRKINYKNKLSS